MMRLMGLGLSLLLAAACFAQTPAFDAASVKVFDPAARPPWLNTGGPGTSDPSRIHLAHASMLELLTRAYGVHTDEISGGPKWIWDFPPSGYYILDATMAAETTKEQFQSMLQNVLAERFKLAVHHETRNFPGYDLVVAKGGPKLAESHPDPKFAPDSSKPAGAPKLGPDGIPIPVGPGCGTTMSSGAQKERCMQTSMNQFVAGLGSTLRIALGGDMRQAGEPVPRLVDKTGLTGIYDFTLEFSCQGCLGLRDLAPMLAGRAGAMNPAAAASDPAGNGLPTIFAALEKQLGLKLEKTKDVPLDVIVIDRIEKLPAEN